MSTPAGDTLTEDDLAGLRRAAAVVRVVAHVELDVLDEGRPHVRVEAHPCQHTEQESGLVRIHPAAFRDAVARAWEDHRARRRVGLIGGRGRPQLAWRVPAPGADLGFGVVRTTCAGRFAWAFASLLPVDELSAVLADVPSPTFGGPSADGPDVLSARLAPDELLGATVVHVDAEIRTVSMVRAVDEVMLTLLAAVTAAELLAGLAAPRS